MAGPILPLAMSMGDPAGVGPVIAWKAWERARQTSGRPFYVIAPPEVMANAARTLWPDGAAPLETIAETGNALTTFPHALPVFPIDGPATLAGKPDPGSAPAIIESIRLAVEHVRAERAAAVVTRNTSRNLPQTAARPRVR
jgi:4-hydroxythreonine-4-phosphate dehydrogenase